jgi:hypothetical protein
MGSAAGGDELEWRVWVQCLGCRKCFFIHQPNLGMVIPEFTRWMLQFLSVDVRFVLCGDGSDEARSEVVATTHLGVVIVMCK